MPEKIIIDCDPGVDDALALFLALASPELTILGITTVAGNRPIDVTTLNAVKLVALAGRSDVPVFRGCGRPLLENMGLNTTVHGSDGLGGAVVPTPSLTEQPGHAVDFLIETLRREPAQSVTLVPVGPLTNVALAFIKAPDIIRRLKRLVIMGGAVYQPGNVTPAAEFNFWVDPAAAHVVLSCGAPLVLFGLDVTTTIAVTAQQIARYSNLGTACGKAAAVMLTSYAAQDPGLHDPCTIAYLLDPTLFQGTLADVGVDYRPGPTAGQSLPLHPPSDHPTTQVIRSAAIPRFFDLLIARISTLP